MVANAIQYTWKICFLEFVYSKENNDIKGGSFDETSRSVTTDLF